MFVLQNFVKTPKCSHKCYFLSFFRDIQPRAGAFLSVQISKYVWVNLLNKYHISASRFITLFEKSAKSIERQPWNYDMHECYVYCGEICIRNIQTFLSYSEDFSEGYTSFFFYFFHFSFFFFFYFSFYYFLKTAL